MAKRTPNISWIGQTLGGRYEIESVLGQGGMSAVYKATDPNLQRTVAVKLIHAHLSSDPEFVRRFEQEAAAVAQLRHPNIIQVYDFNHDDDQYYMVLEFVPGDTLRERLKALSSAHQQLPLPDVIHIMATVCDAVAYAHGRGMIHRDLKPPNVMLTPKGDPILMDFGVAKMLGGTHHTATGAIIGTAKYMSPEQAKGERPDERSDIYALGVMLYEMVAGQAPFEADTSVAVLMKHVNEPVPDIRLIQRDAPDQLVAIIGKALAKKPDDRYRSAVTMAAALRSINLQADEMGATMLQSSMPAKERAGTEPSLPTGTGVTPAPAATGLAGLQPLAANRLPLIIGALAVILILVLGAAAFLLFSGGSDSGENGGETPAAAADDPGLPSSEGMVRINAGSYTVGVDPADRDHAAAQQVDLSEFWIDLREVSNAEYAQFVAETDADAPADWPDGTMPADQETNPVKDITWDQANAYCEWAKKRLPTEAEWEVAARGPEGRLYPWGDDQRAVELPRSGTYPVGSKPTNQSPFGVFDMAGNVWEWVAEPYAPVDQETHRVLRGGTNGFLKDMAYRLQGDPNIPTMFASAGMRCAADQVNVVAAAGARPGVLFQDTFADPGSGWPILAEENALFGYHPPDYYHVEVSVPDDFAAVTRPPEFGDVTVEAMVNVDHTNTDIGDFRYGLVLRRTSEDQYYAFVVSYRGGLWYVLKRSANGLEVLGEGRVDSLVGFAPAGSTPDQSDLLRVDASGPNFVFQINGAAVSQISDSDYSSGEVGFYVENFDETLAHVHYDELVVREVEFAGAEVTPDDKVLFQDDFADPDSGWPVLAEEDALFGYHPPDYYHVEVSRPDDFTSISHAPNIEDMTVESRVLVDHTDTEIGNFRYGLALRRAGEDQYYAFTVSPRSSAWAILKRSPSGLEVLAEGQIDTLRGIAPAGSTPDTPDTLRVDAQGSTFVFHINGEPVAQVSDADYASGEAGFYVENFDETLAHVHYDDLVIRELDPTAISDVPVAAPEPATATPAAVSDSLPTPTPEAEAPTETPEDTPTPSPEPETPAPTSEPSIANGPPAGMVLIPAGSFLMGSASGAPDEQPEHEVFLDAFYIDRYEVSNGQYRECVDAGGCTPGNKADAFTYQGYRDDPAYADYPVIGVTWDQADVYCRAVDKRLPSEAEWEYAASGSDNLIWPWGNTFDATLSAAGAPDLQPVDSYPAGASPFGVYNMAGNAAEWVQDGYDEAFYANSPQQNPVNTGGGSARIFRGGSFANPDGAFYTTSRRFGNTRSFNDVDVGFRCAADVS